MKKLFGVFALFLMVSLTANANSFELDENIMDNIVMEIDNQIVVESESIEAFGACHTFVDTLMVNMIESGAYEGDNAQAVEDWSNLYDVCDALEASGVM